MHCLKPSTVGLYSIYWVGSRFPEKNLADWTHDMLCVSPSAPFVHLVSFRLLKCLFSLEFAVLKLTLLLTYCSSLYHASDLTSVIVLPYLYLCCWQWTYGHLLEKWKHRTFCCLNKKKKKQKKPDSVIFLTMRGSFVKGIRWHTSATKLKRLQTHRR